MGEYIVLVLLKAKLPTTTTGAENIGAAVMRFFSVVIVMVTKSEQILLLCLLRFI